MANKKFYITTAIDYVNAEPHIGHAYQKIIADALGRWHKQNGEKTWFLTGTDEHGKKIAISAKEAGKKPKEFVDLISKKFKEAWDKLNIKYDRFIRTTDSDHEKFVQEFVKRIEKDIYKGEYEGYYCTRCEAYYTEKDLENGCCPYHKTKIEKIKEETYFFKLSKYQKKLLELYKKNPEFILPKERKNEIVNRVKEGLQDLSITRTNFSWGIPFPLDKNHVIYVWFDALLNYLSGANGNWPADLHLLGKDNGWFHAVIWPAMLLSAGCKLPKTVFIHGFLTFDGQKISKSLGNSISPVYLAEKYGVDSIRYYLMKNFVFGEDGDFSEKVLVERHNNELANKLGNLVSRVAALAEKYSVEKTENKLIKKLKLREIEKDLEEYKIDKALNEIFAFIDVCNEYVQNKKPWETHDKKILYELVESIREIARLLLPFIPESAEKIRKQFKGKIKKQEILFRKM
jgi:methionyl-tRNA synthetase